MEAKKINWCVAPFIVLTPLAAIAAVWWLAANDRLYWQTVTLAFVLLAVAGMSITGGYHRLFSHRTYDAAPIVRWFFALFGASAVQGSILQWSSEHRVHHAHVDHERDPYNINLGFWHAHVGWLIFKRPTEETFDNARDLMKDPMIMWQHNNYVPLSMAMCFLFPACVASLWGDFWGGLLVAGLARVVVNHHTTFFINSFCHMIGSRPYSDRHTARDSWLMALFTYGEGYHNYHHEFAADYRNGIRWFQWDPTKWMISLMSYVGLAKNLRRIHPRLIFERRLAMEQKRLQAEMNRVPDALLPRAKELVTAAAGHLQSAAERFYKIADEYREMRREGIEVLQGRLEELKASVAQAKLDFQKARRSWTKVPAQLQTLMVVE